MNDHLELSKDKNVIQVELKDFIDCSYESHILWNKQLYEYKV